MAKKKNSTVVMFGLSSLLFFESKQFYFRKPFPQSKKSIKTGPKSISVMGRSLSYKATQKSRSRIFKALEVFQGYQ